MAWWRSLLPCLLLLPVVSAGCHDPVYTCIDTPEVPLPEKALDFETSWSLRAGNATALVTLLDASGVAQGRLAAGTTMRFHAAVTSDDGGSEFDRYAVQVSAPFGVTFHGSQQWAAHVPDHDGSTQEGDFGFVTDARVFAEHLHMRLDFYAFRGDADPAGEHDGQELTLRVDSAAPTQDGPQPVAALLVALAAVAWLRRR